MTVRVQGGSAVIAEARAHLDRRPEQVGFFLADRAADERAFTIREWRAIGGQDARATGDLHVTLSDEVRASVIKWATATGLCLIEAHSHGKWSPAEFSPYDLANLAEWVPHVSWRLSRRPYAAIVTSTIDFDGLAWIDGATAAEQITALVTEGATEPATGATIASMKEGPQSG